MYFLISAPHITSQILGILMIGMLVAYDDDALLNCMCTATLCILSFDDLQQLVTPLNPRSSSLSTGLGSKVR